VLALHWEGLALTLVAELSPELLMAKAQILFHTLDSVG
jgi:hypothetical protein